MFGSIYGFGTHRHGLTQDRKHLMVSGLLHPDFQLGGYSLRGRGCFRGDWKWAVTPLLDQDSRATEAMQ